MRYKHEATRHVLINAFLAPVRVMSMTIGPSTYTVQVNDRPDLLALIVDDGSEPCTTFTIEFRSMPRPDFDALGMESRAPRPARKCEPVGASAPRDTVRVACVACEGSTYVVPVDDLDTALHEINDDGDEEVPRVYTVTFKSMPRAQFDALGEFDGF